jgi:class 3 adenylate cyclase
MVFNDPIPCDDPAERAVWMAVAMRERVRELAGLWSGMGHDLGFSVGTASGFATLGRIGFDGRYDYAAIGSVTNLAARLCAEAASWQVLVTQRVLTECGVAVVTQPVGDLRLKGFSRPIRAFDVAGWEPSEVTT